MNSKFKRQACISVLFAIRLSIFESSEQKMKTTDSIDYRWKNDNIFGDCYFYLVDFYFHLRSANIVEHDFLKVKNQYKKVIKHNFIHFLR